MADKKSSRKYIKEWGSFIIVVIMLLMLRMIWVDAFRVPTGSLTPSLDVGDFILVHKSSYGYSKYSFSIPFIASSIIPFNGRVGFNSDDVKRGTIIVFREPSHPSINFVKRLIGLPGDTIQMINGRLWINHQLVLRQAIQPYNYQDFNNQEFVPDAQQYLETLPGGVTHKIIELDGDNGMADNTPPYVVPAGHYFMMGDNRDRSMDSRFAAVGYVPYENLIGPVFYIWLSLDYNSIHWWQIWKWIIRYPHMGKISYTS